MEAADVVGMLVRDGREVEEWSGSHFARSEYQRLLAFCRWNVFLGKVVSRVRGRKFT